MRSIQGIWPLVRERIGAHWQLLAVLVFGMLVAATLLAASPIYTRVMSDLGLEYSLRERLERSSRTTAIRFGLPLGTAPAALEKQTIAALMDERLSWFTSSEVRYGAVQRDLTLAREGEPVPTGRFRTVLTLQTVSGLEDHVRVVDGRLPAGASDSQAIEVAMPAEAAAFLGVGPGARFFATHTYDDCYRLPPTDDPEEARERARFPCVPQTFVTLGVPLELVGVVEQIDAEDPYWAATGRLTFVRPSGTDAEGPIVPVILSERGFYSDLPRLLPGIPSEFRLTSFADITRLNSANIGGLRDDLLALRGSLQAREAIGDIPMAGAIDDFTRRSSFNQIPLLILLLQVVGISVYYVVLVSSMLVERRAEEIAMLRSRGASVGQVTLIAAMEATLLGIVAALVAPFVAAGIVALLGKTGTFAGVSGGDFLPFTVLPVAFGYAAAGSAIAIIAVVVPTFFMARRSMVQFLHGAARPRKSFIQTYYIDVAFAGLAAYAFYELNQRGSVFDPRSVGGWSADPLLMLSPLILILAVGTLLFRFLPMLLAFVARLMKPTAGAGTILALWQLTRSPGRYTQLALLVIMAGAVGTFAATYGATTDRSQEERARYEVGMDVRTSSTGNLRNMDSQQMRERVLQIEGVEEAAVAFRGGFTLGPLPGFGSQIDVLGLDPAHAASVLWFRNDFASESLDSLLRRLVGSPSGGQGIVLPDQPVAITAWVNPQPARGGTTLWVRTRDAIGTFRMYELGQIDHEGYQQLAASFDAQRDGIVYPLSIVGLTLSQPPGITDAGRGDLFIDDIGVVDVSGRATVVEDFSGPFRWEPLRTATRNRDTALQTYQGQHSGQAAAQFSFRIGTSVQNRGMIVSDPNLPVPAIASTRFLARTGLSVGSEVELVVGGLILPVTIRGATSLFPSMADPSDGFLIVNQEHLYYFTGLTGQTAARAPSEVWLTLSSDPEDRSLALRRLTQDLGIVRTQIINVEEVLDRVRTDPVIRAGGSGILLIALVAALAILGLGFGLTLYIGGQLRTVEVSVLRAVGLSRSHVFAMVALEYALVAALGLIIGTVAGLRISATMLSFLNVTEQGHPLIPPFALETRWDMLGLAFSLVVVAFAVGIVVLAVYFLRVPVSRILRLTR
jgi:ABC-type antimicrobial peptide transport system permease subunit